jgi:hypothetical protein
VPVPDHASSTIKAMVIAIDDLDLDGVRRLLRDGADPNGRDEFGWPMLFWAIDAEVDAATQTEEPLTVEISRALLQAGASPLVGSGDATPLGMAEERGHTLAAALLREAITDRG